MAALDSAGVRWLIQMALKTQAICGSRRQFQGVLDFFRGTGFRVSAARPVTGLAGFSVPPVLFVQIDNLMRTLLKCVEGVLMTGLTDFRPDVSRRLVLRGLGRRRLAKRQARKEDRRSQRRRCSC